MTHKKDLVDAHAATLVLAPLGNEIRRKLKEAMDDLAESGVKPVAVLASTTSMTCDILASMLGGIDGKPESREKMLLAALRRIRKHTEESWNERTCS